MILMLIQLIYTYRNNLLIGNVESTEDATG